MYIWNFAQCKNLLKMKAECVHLINFISRFFLFGEYHKYLGIPWLKTKNGLNSFLLLPVISLCRSEIRLPKKVNIFM